MLLLSLPSGIHIPVNSILPMVGYYDSSDPYNINIDTFNHYILHMSLVVLLFLLFYPSGGYTDQIFQSYVIDSPLPYVNHIYLGA
jgi:hypothetical protein